MPRSQAPVAVISGASRGLGKGIALSLGAGGFTVYLAGRNGARRDGEAALPGTLEETASRINAAGGKAIAVHCDMAQDQDIGRLFEQVGDETGGLDILVNNAAFLHDAMGMPGPFWEKPAELADIIDVGLRCHYLALHHAVPLMLGRPHPLVANISFFGHAGMHDPAYHAAKAGLDAMAASAAIDLRKAGIAIVSLWPGIVATERLQGILQQMPQLAEQLPVLESSGLTGKIIAALYQDPALTECSGKTLIVAELARHYGIVDDANAQPASLRGAFGAPHPKNDFIYGGEALG